MNGSGGAVGWGSQVTRQGKSGDILWTDRGWRVWEWKEYACPRETRSGAIWLTRGIEEKIDTL